MNPHALRRLAGATALALLVSCGSAAPSAVATSPATNAEPASPPPVTQDTAQKTTPADEKAPFNFAPDAGITDEQLGNYYVEMQVAVDGKDAGKMELTLWADKAPKHVRNFLRYCATGFYDGLSFHRVIREFMVQGGQSTSTDRTMFGNVEAEFSQDPDRSHVYGVLSAARLGNDVNSASSQFFIVCKTSPHLDGQYSSFGKLSAGVATLEALANAKTVPGSPENSVPAQPVTITKATVIEGKPKGTEKIERPMAPGPKILRVQHVLVSFDSVPRINAPRTKEEAEKLAQDILARAQKGEDFTAMVREYSDDPNHPDDPQPGTYRMTNTGYDDAQLAAEQQAMMAEAQQKFGEYQQEIQQKVASGELAQDKAQEQVSNFMQKLRFTALKDMVTPRGSMVTGFGDVAFGLEVGEIGMAAYDEKNSPFGWHVIKRLE